jgi:hypothetical protein
MMPTTSIVFVFLLSLSRLSSFASPTGDSPAVPQAPLLLRVFENC